MKFNILKYAPIIEKARTSFWFVPSFMVIISILLAVFVVYIDAIYIDSTELTLPLVYQMDIDAMRSLLGTIAGAMITVTSIAFSITIVALTLASSQFGPRLLRNFMMDTGTQVVLGSFISNFMFCILAFCAISFQQPYAFKPGLTIIVALIMTFLSVVVLIYFIHHVAKSIQADVVINDVYRELNFGIEHLFPSEHKKNNSAVSIDSISADFTSLAYQENVLAKCSGYVQTTDYEEILLIATKSDSVIECKFGPGDFVVQGTLIAIIYSDNIVDEKEIKKISDRILLGACRTPVQDPEFAIHQLVEIALRALSPGINDPYSAITCVDKLNSVLCGLTERVFPSKQHFDQKGILRVVCKVLTFKDVATAAFEQIRQHANNNVAVTMRLLSSLHELIGFANTEEQKEFVIRQTKIIKEQQFNRSLAEADLNVISEKVELILSGKK